jgi:hypothetical protein
MCIRLLQGVFGGAVGVARGTVPFVTDPSNEGRAYAILGFAFSARALTEVAHNVAFRFCWGFGGVAGAIVGGACKSTDLVTRINDKSSFYLSREACDKVASNLRRIAVVR